MSKSNHLIIREWLEKKFKEQGRGARAALARYLSIDKNAVTRMLKPQGKQGYRVITADELIKISRFFGDLPPGLSAAEIHAERNEIIELYKQAKPEQQQIILSLLKSFAPPKKKK